MTPEKLKTEMMKLWKKTFHDSDDYIHLVFDNYFAPEFVEYEEVDGYLIAAMLAVPYTFYMPCHLDSDSDGLKFNYDLERKLERNELNALSVSEGAKTSDATDAHDACVSGEPTQHDSIKALYLCGLSTVEEHRGRGIMSRMIERMNERAAQRGYAFTFLIPASDGLRKYYSDRGYISAFSKYLYNYSSAHDFYNEVKNYIDRLNKKSVDYLIFNIAFFDKKITNKSENNSDISRLAKSMFDELQISTISNTDYCNLKNIALNLYGETGNKCGNYDNEKLNNIFAEIVEYICSLSLNPCCNNHKLRLLHSKKDISLFLLEAIQSGGEIVYAIYNNSVCGVSIIELSEDAGTVVVKKVFSRSKISYYKILEFIKNMYSDKSMQICMYSHPHNPDSLWSPYYIEPSSTEGLVEPYEEAFSPAKLRSPYGMLRVANLFQLLKLLWIRSGRSKFSILVNVDSLQYLGLNDAFNGILSSKKARDNDNRLVSNGLHVQNDSYNSEMASGQKISDGLKNAENGVEVNASNPDPAKNRVEVYFVSKFGIDPEKASKIRSVLFEFDRDNYQISLFGNDGKFVCELDADKNRNIFEKRINPFDVMSLPEVSALMFRPYSGNREVENAIDIPEVEGVAGLLLD